MAGERFGVKMACVRSGSDSHGIDRIVGLMCANELRASALHSPIQPPSHHPQIPPSRRVAGKDQYLMPLRCVVEHALHAGEAVVVGVDQGVVEDQQGGFAGLLQQIGVGEAGDDAHLFAGAEAELLKVAGFAAALAAAGDRAG